MDLYSTLEFPKSVTLLDRQLLLWHCNRHNEAKGKAWPSMSELMNITGVHEKSISRSRTRLVKLGALKLVTRAHKGQLQANYAVVETWLMANQRVTDELPNMDKELQATTQQVTVDDLKGNASALNGLPVSNPKPNKPNKPNKLNKPIAFRISDNRFKELVVNNLPHELRQKITNGFELDDELSKLLEAGYSDQQIKDKLNLSYLWKGINSPYPFVLKFLATLWQDRPVLAIRFDPVAPEVERIKNAPPKDIEAFIRNGFKTPDSF